MVVSNLIDWMLGEPYTHLTVDPSSPAFSKCILMRLNVP